MVRYDPMVLQRFAQIMYRRAAMVVFTWTVLFLILGAILGYGGVISLRLRENEQVAVIITAAVTGLIGFMLGQEKAFWLRLQAQNLLCQMQIEMNTRQQAHMPTFEP